MRRRAVLMITMVGAMLLAFGGVVLAQQQGGGTPPKTPTDKIPDRYIVVFEEDAVGDPRAVANEHAQANGLQLKHVYRHAIEGYAAVFPNERSRQRVENDPRVDYVEQDGVVNAVAQADDDPAGTAKKPGSGGGSTTPTTSQTLPWGIKMIWADQSSTKAGDGTDAISNVNAYIIDSGIDTAHQDLNIKVANHVNFAGGQNTDCNGHGTHVAGTVAAKDDAKDVVGVAPGAALYGVKVLGCNGSGSWSGVIAGVDWVTANAVKPAVANMSLGGGKSQAVDDAVVNSANSGVFYALAAGNDGADACNSSPARAGTATTDKNNDGVADGHGIMTVAATNKTDGETSWSNYGPCVDIWAPGANILSTKRGGGTTTMSGTSMASPHVAGGGALYLSNNTTKKPSELEGALKAAATKMEDDQNTADTDESKKSKDGRIIEREYVKNF